MGRTSMVDKTQLVCFDKIENVSRCLLCDKALKGYLLGNIKRHYVTIHKRNFDDELMEEIKTNDESRTSDVPSKPTNDHMASIKYHVPELYMPVKPKVSKTFALSDSHDETSRNKSEKSLQKTPEVAPKTNAVRKRKTLREEELQPSLEVIEPVVRRKSLRDHSDIFGEHVAAKHRKYSSHVKNVVEHLISQVLFEADMGKHGDPRRHFSRKRSAPSANLSNPFLGSDQEEERPTTSFHDVKTLRSSSVSSASDMLERPILYSE